MFHASDDILADGTGKRCVLHRQMHVIMIVIGVDCRLLGGSFQRLRHLTHTEITTDRIRIGQLRNEFSQNGSVGFDEFVACTPFFTCER